tara:strand:+ start:101 stop:580 length:480 start_codon:yes stop_codon:yes gene_type:complete
VGKEWGDCKIMATTRENYKTINNGKTEIYDFRENCSGPFQELKKGVTVILEDQTCSYGRILKHGCEYGIHKAGCRDIKRGLKKNFGTFSGVFPRIQNIYLYDTLEKALQTSVPEYASESDMYDDSIRSCKEATLKAGDHNDFVYVYPCCKDANCGGDQE